MYMSPFDKLATSHIWTGIWPSTRYITISTATYFQVNFLQSLFDLLFNFCSVKLLEIKIILILILYVRGLPQIWVKNIVTFMCILLQKELIGNDLLRLYNINVTHAKFLDKICNLISLINIPKKNIYFINKGLLKWHPTNGIHMADGSPPAKGWWIFHSHRSHRGPMEEHAGDD